jgi:hypothetical protein
MKAAPSLRSGCYCWEWSAGQTEVEWNYLSIRRPGSRRQVGRAKARSSIAPEMLRPRIWIGAATRRFGLRFSANCRRIGARWSRE